MSLGTLLNNTDCGPSNPLQQLSKRLDTDRGIQQVTESSGLSQEHSYRYTCMECLTHGRLGLLWSWPSRAIPSGTISIVASINQTIQPPIYRYSTSLELEIHLSSRKQPSSSRRVQHPKPSTLAGSQRRYRCRKLLLMQIRLPEMPHGTCRPRRFCSMTPLRKGGLWSTSPRRSRGPNRLLVFNLCRDQW